MFPVDVNQFHGASLFPDQRSGGEAGADPNPLKWNVQWGENGDRENMITAQGLEMAPEPSCYAESVPTAALLPWPLTKPGANVDTHSRGAPGNLSLSFRLAFEQRRTRNRRSPGVLGTLWTV